MAKTQATSALPPLRLTTGADILAEDIVEAVEQLNWSALKRPACHVSEDVNATSRGADVYETIRQGYYAHWAEYPTARVEAECTIVTDHLDVRFTCGANTQVLNFTSSGVLSADITNNGNLWSVEINTPSGTSQDSTLDRIRIQDKDVTSSLPGPQNE